MTKMLPSSLEKLTSTFHTREGQRALKPSKMH
jgi:hypothetical protein